MRQHKAFRNVSGVQFVIPKHAKSHIFIQVQIVYSFLHDLDVNQVAPILLVYVKNDCSYTCYGVRPETINKNYASSGFINHAVVFLLSAYLFVPR